MRACVLVHVQCSVATHPWLVQGFFRGDESLSHPFTATESVSTTVLILYSFILPLILLPLLDFAIDR